MVFMRRLAKIIPVPRAESLGVPVLDNDPADPTWTHEIMTGDEDSTMSFEKRALHPHPCAKRIKVSETLLRKAAINVESLVRERLSYKYAVTEENAYLNGTGVNQPLGCMIDVDSGITSSRDVTTGNTSSEIKADGLIECKYKLEAQYRTNCNWIFHRDAVKMIRKLKYGDGTYIWKAGISSDRPDTILDYPVYESEYQLNTFSASQLVGILGDFSYYWIADCLAMRIQALYELYAESNQVGFILRAEVDGAPVHEKAFARVKLSA
jgi:HK97 family phage major capsid protein